MNADAITSLGRDASIEEVRRSIIGRVVISQPYADQVRLNEDQRKRVIAFSDGLVVVPDGERSSPLVESAVRMIGLRVGSDRAQMVVSVPLRTIETMHAVLQGDTRLEAVAGTTGDEQWWEKVLSYAAQLGASDVLIRAEATGTEVHVVVGGLRQPAPFEMPTSEGVRRCGVLYQLSTGKGEFDQRGFHRSSIPNERLRSLGVDRRVSSARLQFHPAPDGVHVSIRIGDERSLKGVRFEDYRLMERTAAALRDVRSFAAGVVTHCGPPGGGKTTLQALQLASLQAEAAGTRMIILLEDTREIQGVPGVYIVPLGYRDAEERDNLLEQALEEVLRSPVQTLCVGEVRSLTAARMLFQGAQTGVQVITTVHALSAMGSVRRYRGMELPASDVFDASINRGAVGQRLLPRLCEGCRVPLRDVLERLQAGSALPGDRHREALSARVERWASAVGVSVQRGGGGTELRDRAAAWRDLFHLRGEGCGKCHGNATADAPQVARGFYSRQPVVEALAFDDRLLDLLAIDDRRGARNYAIREQGFEPMILHAASLALAGLVCPEDVETSVGRFGDATMLADGA